MKKTKLLDKILRNKNNVQFDEFASLIRAFGFVGERITGSHQIFRHSNPTVLLNVQSEHDKAKPYQIRQFLAKVERYGLKLEEE